MENVRYTFRVDTKRVKVTIFLVSMFVFIFFGILEVAGYIRWGYIFPFPLFFLVFSLVLFVILWMYGNYRIFGFEWRLYDEGVQILKDNHEVKFVLWEDVAKIKTIPLTIFTRDGSKLPVRVPPPIQREMVKEIHDIMNRRKLTCAWTYPLLSRNPFKKKDS